MFLLGLAIAPSIAIMIFIYSRDRYEKEPAWLLLKMFFFGCLTVFPAAFLESIIPFNLEESNNLIAIFLFAVLGVGLIEEGCKYFVLRNLTEKCKDFNQMYDAIVYSVFVSLGFATIENILYVLQFGTKTGIMRAITSVPGHAIFGITMGYYLGMATFTGNDTKKKTYMTLSIVMPVIFHGVYDFLLMSKHPFLVLLFIPFMVYLYMNGIKKTKTLCKMDNYNRRLEKQKINQEMNYYPYNSYVGNIDSYSSPFGPIDPYHSTNSKSEPYTNYQKVNYDYLRNPNPSASLNQNKSSIKNK